RMEYGVRDRGRDAHHGELADALHAERVHVRVMLLDEDHVHDPWAVGVDRHCVFGEVRVWNAAVAPVDHGMLHERHADATDHAANALATRRLGIHDATGSVRSDD